MVVPKVGVLGLQGAYAKHSAVLRRLKVNTRIVRYPRELEDLDGLVIPGGESTAITKLIEFIGLRTALKEFGERGAIFGTCAGMILMARETSDPEDSPLGLMDISVSRNAYGRQVDSFTRSLSLHLNGTAAAIQGVFIRAPRITSIGPAVETLSEIDGEPVLVKQGRHLAAAFHPELSDSTDVHRYFLSLLSD